jgi:transcriptional regulator with XRE-family HTH domain
MTPLQNLIADSGKLQKQVAADLGISASAFNQYVTGKRQPSQDILISIARYFDVSVDYLIGNESEQQKKPTEANVPDELLNSPIKLEALSVFSSLSAEDQQLFIELMRSRGKQ